MGGTQARGGFEARETSGATTTLLVRYVRLHGGDAAVAQMLALAGASQTAAELENTSLWVSYDTRIKLFEAAVIVLDDPHAMFEVGATALTQGMHHALETLLRAFGSPREVFRQTTRSVAKFSTTSSVDNVECSATSATIHYRLHDGYTHSRLDCEYAQGLYSSIPTIFNLPPARIVHDECESDGFPGCVYELSWDARKRWRRSPAPSQPERSNQAAVKLQLQLEELQLAAVDLASSDDVADVLERIIERASKAVIAPSYLLVVGAADGRGGPPSVHSRGLEPARVVELTAAMLRGDDLGPSAVVVEVASTRRAHGHLAALYTSGHRSFDGDRDLLEAYARHAAAALDLLTALDDSRREGRRSAALLALSHELAAASTSDGVTTLVASALPSIIGSEASAVLLWDSRLGVLQAVSSSGFEPVQAELLAAATIRPDETPELIDVLTHQRPIFIDLELASPELAGVLAGICVRSVIVAPLLAGDDLMGIAAAAWTTALTDDVVREALTTISGVSDQAATALQNARLLSKVRHQALHDPLTDLPNRTLFAQRLTQTLLESGPATKTAVLFCDLDNFKQLNDDLGHGAGDELLRQAAVRLCTEVRPGDTIGRLGGDEFAVVLRDVKSEREAIAVARRMVGRLNVSFRIEGRDLRVTASVGVALNTGSDGRGDQLLAAADAAMYAAKKRGRNQVTSAGSSMRALPGRSLRAELAAALRHDELRMHFQPVVDIRAPGALTVVGVEAPIRWQHPRLGLLAPAAFLPLAEETGLVTELDLWAVGTACAGLAAWQRVAGRPLHVAVNLAGATLVDARLLPTVRAALSTHRLDPALLMLEIVESRSLVDLPGVIGLLGEVRQLGVRISLDDFGTGFSTLALLKALPVDQIKIDRSFIIPLPDDASLTFVRGVLALARELRLEVVAEGVETRAQLDALRAAGCPMVQGYLLGRPRPRLDASTLVVSAGDDPTPTGPAASERRVHAQT